MTTHVIEIEAPPVDGLAGAPERLGRRRPTVDPATADDHARRAVRGIDSVLADRIGSHWRPASGRRRRQRAIRMVLDHEHEYPSQWKAIGSVAEKLDVHRETLRVWVRRAEVGQGGRPGLTTDDRAQMKELERELRRSNEILKAASAFFEAELDRQSKK